MSLKLLQRSSAVLRRSVCAMSTASGNGKPALSASSDAAIVDKLVGGGVKLHQLETELQDYTRASALRRQFFKRQLDAADAKRGAAAPLRSAGLSGLPLDNFNAEQFLRSVHGRNCEAVVGYVPLPVGLVGPLLLDDEELLVPLATTEGALVASTNRGCRVISESGGARTVLTSDGMTRAPVLRLSSLDDVARLSAWVESPEGFAELKAAFDSTSKFARLLDVSCHTAGRSVYLRFRCNTGDAMGMNMISKGVAVALEAVRRVVPDYRLVSLSGNFCTDKKPSSVNWLQGRGKSVVCEVVIPAAVLSSVLHTSVDAMVELNVSKNLVGSCLAGSVGGFNAHASNMVTAVFLATGQDPAQNVESSNCMTLMEKGPDGSLIASVTMPSIEVGTVGGGTALAPQKGMLELLGVGGSHASSPGQNAARLARVVAATVLAGELSLMAALTTNDLVKAHMALGRKETTTTAASSVSASPVHAATAGRSVGPSHAPTAAMHTASGADRRAHVHTAVAGAVPSSSFHARRTASTHPGRKYFADPSSSFSVENSIDNDSPRICVP